MLSLFLDFMDRGGLVMWPLLALSVVGVTLCFERGWFWLRTNQPAYVRRMSRMARLLRQGELAAARTLADEDPTVYGRLVRQLIDEGTSDAVVTEAIESQRPALERFMATLSTIITAAPMLGILGTVTGIIASFRVLSDQAMATDPRAVSSGIAEALLTTVAGLVIAIAVLFPYNAYRAQLDRTFGRIEMLVAAATRGLTKPSEKHTPPAKTGVV